MSVTPPVGGYVPPTCHSAPTSPRTEPFPSPRPPALATSLSLPGSSFVPAAVAAVERSSTSSGATVRHRRQRSISERQIKHAEGKVGDAWKRTPSLMDSLKALNPFHRTAESVSPRSAEPVDQVKLYKGIVKVVQFLSCEERMKTRGMFRESGSSEALEMVVDWLQNDYGPLACSTEPLVAGEALKRLLAKVDFPERFKQGIWLFGHQSGEDLTEYLNKEITMMVPRQWFVLQAVMQFLAKFSGYHAENLMTASNIGLMFGPVLFPLIPEKPSLDDVSVQMTANAAFESLLNHYIERIKRQKLACRAMEAELSCDEEPSIAVAEPSEQVPDPQ